MLLNNPSRVCCSRRLRCHHRLLMCLVIANIPVSFAWTTVTSASIPGLSSLTLNKQKYTTRLPARNSGRRRQDDFLHPDEHNDDLATSLHQQSASASSPTSTGNSGSNVTATAYFEKQARILQARAKIDRIVNGPDPPFDMQAELQKVKSIAPPSPATHLQSPVDLQVEERVMQLEEEIQSAIQRQDFTRAATIQQEIGQLHVDDCGAVLQVNAQFYKAFSLKDYSEMQAVWLKDGTATCIHPSQKALVGSKNVLQSFQRMFASSSGAFQKSWMEPVNIRISVKGATTAVVTCDENVYARRFVRGQRRQTELVNKLIATNIFRKAGGKWYLTHHHSSWHADSQVSKQALAARGKGGGVSSGSNKNGAGSASFEDDDDDDMGDEENEPVKDGDENDKVALEGILGMQNFGPLLGDGDTKKEKKKVKGVIMGSLNDILGGGLGDIFSSNSGSENSSDSPPKGKAIIRFARISPENNINNNIENAMNLEEDMMEYDDAEVESEDEDENEDDLKKNRLLCIATLRKLSAMGAISPRQKRVLITDIITCSAKDESSLVEIAHQLLLGSPKSKNDGDDDDYDYDDAALEDFADQCRVVASNLSGITSSTTESS